MMDMTFWQQFCTSPDGTDPCSSPTDDLCGDQSDDLDSSPGWSPLSSLDDQENYSLPPLMGGQYHHPTSGYSTPVTSHSHEYSNYGNHPLTLQHQYNTYNNTNTATTPLRGGQHHHSSNNNNNNISNTTTNSTKSSHPSGRSKNPVKRIAQRTAANHRERKRMKTINEAFEGLRERIPLAAGDRKLSKVDTLRLAIRYIHHLSDMVTTCGTTGAEGTLAGGANADPDAAKVIIRCHGPDLSEYCSADAMNANLPPLYGHSLSWVDDKQRFKPGPGGRLVAKLWIPEAADPSTLHHDSTLNSNLDVASSGGGAFDCDSLSL